MWRKKGNGSWPKVQSHLWNIVAGPGLAAGTTARWDLLMISLLTEATGWKQGDTASLCVFGFSPLHQNSKESPDLNPAEPHPTSWSLKLVWVWRTEHVRLVQIVKAHRMWTALYAHMTHPQSVMDTPLSSTVVSRTLSQHLLELWWFYSHSSCPHVPSACLSLLYHGLINHATGTPRNPTFSSEKVGFQLQARTVRFLYCSQIQETACHFNVMLFFTSPSNC